ncbi:MAG: hypothetical protein ATN34_03215 [Epulopiscium sp. Nele67-Bin002]|nr:MAG: hypothetical protein BEN18_05125 [Epulopiscium sp. Nuni2H_MBin001]OON91302.1 MAG: hypothetical protein ATN34_03215 [Epulopiscium sp. Nele67-Bin002]OON94294.1 MAG: hypothetical protein ATN33_04590 [Epulopiscium sp. Nele67-Bin001]
MPNDNLVIFKGEVDGLLVMLDEEARFEDLLRCFIKKLEQNKGFFDGAKIVVRFKGRKLGEFEKECIIELLATQNIVEIVFLHPFDDEATERLTITPKEKKKIVKNTNSKAAAIINARSKDKPRISNTYYHAGILRSGQEIVQDGCIVVMGDVNPGAVVKASENIIILGTLKGRAFAGDGNDNKKSFIISYGINAEQIGITNHIVNSPRTKMCAQIAYIDKEQIYIKEIDFKSLQNMIE